MELDELKIEFKKITGDGQNLSADSLAALLDNNTHAVIGKLKKSLWIEIGCYLLFIPLIVYMALFGDYSSLRIYFAVFTIPCVFFLIQLFHLLMRIKQLSAYTLPVKKNLETIHSIIKTYTRRYLRFTFVLIPVCLIFSFLLGYYTSSQPIPAIEEYIAPYLQTDTKVFAFLAIAIVVFTVGVFFFNKWYLNRLYGRYLRELEKNIKELGK